MVLEEKFVSSVLWPTREQAWEILNQYTKNPNLVKHGLAVEAVMRALAAKEGDDVELFGLVGLLHDFDYELFPEIGQHTIAGGNILREAEFPEHIIHAIQSHVTENNIPRDTLLKKAIFAADELTGFIVAVARVKPDKSLSQVSAPSVKKKLKDKGFARGVNRTDVYEGVAGLEEDLDAFIQFIVDALIPIAPQIDLNP